MIDSQFFYDWEERSYTIEKSVLEKIKSLKGTIEESGYYEDMVKWYFNGSDKELQDLWITMQFLSMTAKPTDELIRKYHLNDKRKYLINLMRQLYLDVDNHGSLEGNSIMMGYKRPFGNSAVDYDYGLEREVLKEFANFIIDFFAGGFEVRWYSFEKPKEVLWQRKMHKSHGMDRIHSFMTQWKPAKSELRAIVLDKILDNDL